MWSEVCTVNWNLVYGRTEYFECLAGTRQGCMHSPLLFSLYVNDIVSYLENQDCKRDIYWWIFPKCHKFTVCWWYCWWRWYRIESAKNILILLTHIVKNEICQLILIRLTYPFLGKKVEHQEVMKNGMCKDNRLKLCIFVNILERYLPQNWFGHLFWELLQHSQKRLSFN